MTKYYLVKLHLILLTLLDPYSFSSSSANKIYKVSNTDLGRLNLHSDKLGTEYSSNTLTVGYTCNNRLKTGELNLKNLLELAFVVSSDFTIIKVSNSNNNSLSTPL